MTLQTVQIADFSLAFAKLAGSCSRNAPKVRIVRLGSLRRIDDNVNFDRDGNHSHGV